MNILERHWSFDMQVKQIDDTHYVFENESLTAYLEILYEQKVNIIIKLNYNNEEYVVYEKDLIGVDVFAQVDKILLRYIKIPEIIKKTNEIIREKLLNHKINYIKESMNCYHNHFFINYYIEDILRPFLSVQFDEFKNFSVYLNYIKYINGYKIYFDFSTLVFTVNLSDIEDSIETILNIKVQEEI